MNISFTKKELKLLQGAVGNYVEIMGEAEATAKIVDEELDAGLKSVTHKIFLSKSKSELGVKY